MAVNQKTMKMGPGVVKIGPSSAPLPFMAEVSEAKMVPSVKEGAEIPLLSGDVAAEATTYTWKFQATVLQNLSVRGIVGYLLKNQGQVQDFEFTPNTTDGAKWVGSVRLDPPEVGGKVGASDTTKIELAFVGQPTFTPATKVNGLAP